MSDFLGRLAARAVGEAPVARPRVPALFEAASGSAEPRLEVVDEEVVGGQGREPAPPGPRAERQTGQSSSAEPPNRGAEETRPASDGGARREHEAAARRGPAEPPIGQRPAIGRSTERPRPDSRVEAAPVAVEPAVMPERSSPDVVAAQRAAPVRTELQAAAAAEPRPSSTQPPPVRVHIGRLEVRAKVQEPPRPQVLREEPREQGLSLADYLRGGRDAR